MNNKGFTLWFTGLSGAGKTTLAVELEKELRKRGIRNVQRLDGDIVRSDLCRDLGFSRKDRDENIRRVTFVAEVLSRNGVATLVAFISPYREARQYARSRCQNFVEVYLRCELPVLIERDVKGLYQKALNGEIVNFTGISDPYEEPESPELIIDTARKRIPEAVREIIMYLQKTRLINPE